MTETKPANADDAQFKGIGFHQTLAVWVDRMVYEFALYHNSPSPTVNCMFTVYKMLLPMLPYIRSERGEDAVEKFEKQWAEINRACRSRAFECDGIVRNGPEAVYRYDAIMALLADSGLIRLATREENWEDAFVDTLEEKMEREE